METTLSHPLMATATQQISTPRRVGLIMTYNQRETCVEAINSLLTQTLVLDLIIVSDDCSTDGTSELIADYFSKNGKPSNVVLYQSEKNLGFIPHFNALLKNHCRDDDLIFYNAGDDISETSRVEEFYREYVTKGKPRHFLGHSYVTSFGSGTEEILVPPIESIKDNRELCLIASAYHIGASQVFTGALFFDFGPILFDDCYEDLTLGYRALLKNSYHFIPKALLRYRVGGLSSWQKNPLEKKRGRLKSTLTQRAVDSMRSGDFEALTTIQDCYSQYGFSHLPHHNKIRVTVVSDETLITDLCDYSVADHFPLISNVCELTWNSPIEITESLGKFGATDIDRTDLYWIIAPRVALAVLPELIKTIAWLKEKRTVIDLGITHSLEMTIAKLPARETNEILSRQHPNLTIHTANQHLYTQVRANPGLPQATYIPPLQSIDGPDPVKLTARTKCGIVIAVNTSSQSQETLESLHRVHSTKAPNLGSLILVQPEDISSNGKISNGTIFNHSKNEKRNLKREIHLTDFDYLIIKTAFSPEYQPLTEYFWLLAAKNCIPTFIDSGILLPSYLTNGSNYLSVDNSIQAWDALFNLVDQHYELLQIIASRARRDAYFNFSAQKRIHALAQLANTLHSKSFFEKFLPL